MFDGSVGLDVIGRYLPWRHVIANDASGLRPRFQQSMCTNLLSINASRNRSSHRLDFAIRQIQDVYRSRPDGLLKHPACVSVARFGLRQRTEELKRGVGRGRVRRKKEAESAWQVESLRSGGRGRNKVGHGTGFRSVMSKHERFGGD